MAGLTGAEGAAIDPVTGDFLFSTFGGGNQVVVVQGFAIPPTPTPTPTPPGPTPTVAPTTTPSPPVAAATVPMLSFPLLALLGVLLAGVGFLLTRRS